MRFTFLASTIVTSVSVLAAPTGLHSRTDVLVEPRAALAKPAPCVRDPSATEMQNKARFNTFVQALIYKPDITEAFSYVAQDYVNHGIPLLNGFDTGWDVFSLTWDLSSITPLGSTFQYPQGWVKYKKQFREVVERFRMDGGCIVEHWVQNEEVPLNAMTVKRSHSNPITHCCAA
ncbi:hypothetical protein COCMIDRAFT_6515 [Bipolaris oryzae ATCC 44560]|uniref:SnoaL-like domain-containing protein n=1 Tax=Bipolaris oryzae ATCC 44560 TaxID=930090 RepID=W6Z967_COCMI|nr:uncharacterized protein COCMIDRAFT_6515 [Bipolaris oryzae ATCC 44560]EUC44104.1 hypothetical protein COCMIDRAFT_6515 [Bipolaris oryzae ATCC 44560]